MPRTLEKKLIEKFKDKPSFTREELFRFYRSFEPDLKEGTFGWRIHDLNRKSIIQTLKKGLYAISFKSEYIPEISENLKDIAEDLSKNFDEVKLCLWDSLWLNEFINHQITRSVLFIESEKDIEESVYYFLRDSGYENVFINPDVKTMDYYLAGNNQSIIVKNLISRAPLSKLTENEVEMIIPGLEKILVDVYTGKDYFQYLQGSELVHLFENVFRKYPVNFTRLFSYAGRRNKENELKEFVSRLALPLVKDIIDD